MPSGHVGYQGYRKLDAPSLLAAVPRTRASYLWFPSRCQAVPTSAPHIGSGWWEVSEFAFCQEINIVLLEFLIDPALGVVLGNPSNLNPH
jgi:hypothetical protein